MEEIVFMLVNNADNARKCEQILEEYRTHSWLYTDSKDKRPPTMLSHFLSNVSNPIFRRLFHVNKETLSLLAKEIRVAKTFKLSPLSGYGDEEVVDFVCVAVLYINTCFSVRCCAQFCGLSVGMIESYINQFNKMMNELKDKIIRFPALNCQSLLKVNSKRFFPGAVGVVDTVFIPKLYSVDETCFSFSEKYRKQGIKLLLVVGRDGKFFNIHISENGGQSNCSIYNESALGYTLRYHKRSVLNRGSFLIADRSYPELPYLQIPFSNTEIQQSRHPSTLSNYNYWHHKARFIAEKSIKRWLFRSPKCRQGLPYSSPRNCIIFVISSLVLHQMCQMLDDDWMDDDNNIPCVILASQDGTVVEGVDNECYKIYDISSESAASHPYETDYYDLKNMDMTTKAGSSAEIDVEDIPNSTYEKLKIVARKRRDFLVDLVYLFPNRAALFYDD